MNEREDILRKMYPRYDGSQWVLWIVAECYSNLPGNWCNGHMRLLKEDGSVLQGVPPYKVITPYPNTCIRQIAAKKSSYGYPLIFDSFEDLCKVKEVLIRWDNSFAHEDPGYPKQKYIPFITDYSLRYELLFEHFPCIEPASKWYTVNIVQETFDGKNADQKIRAPQIVNAELFPNTEQGLTMSVYQYYNLQTKKFKTIDDPYHWPMSEALTVATKRAIQNPVTRDELLERMRRVNILEGFQRNYDRLFSTLDALARHLEMTVPECKNFTKGDREFTHMIINFGGTLSVPCEDGGQLPTTEVTDLLETEGNSVEGTGL